MQLLSTHEQIMALPLVAGKQSLTFLRLKFLNAESKAKEQLVPFLKSLV